MRRPVAALLFLVGSLWAQSPAGACRDCPFPTPLAALHWRMPGGLSDVVIQEIEIGRGKIQSVVRLLDAQTGDLLAVGFLDHAKGRKRIKVDLTDSAGGKMMADVYYLNARRDKVQIKITCQLCNVKSAYLN